METLFIKKLCDEFFRVSFLMLQIALLCDCNSNLVKQLVTNKIASKGYIDISRKAEELYFIDEAEKKCASLGMRLPNASELMHFLEGESPVRRPDQTKCYWTNEILGKDTDYYKTICPKFLNDYPIKNKRFSDIFNDSADIFQSKQKAICYSNGKDHIRKVNYFKEKERVEVKENFVLQNNTKVFSSDSQYSKIIEYLNRGDRVFIKALGKEESLEGKNGRWAYIGRSYNKESWIFRPEVSEIDPLDGIVRQNFDLEYLQRIRRESIDKCLKIPNCDY